MINHWLEKTIIGLDLCPFTRRPYLEGKILIEEHADLESSGAQDHFLTSLCDFQSQQTFETALIVYPKWKISFRDFYDFSEDLSDQLSRLHLEEEFQLVAFHPQFCFEGLDYSNRANLVNSSPYPLIHILKIIDLDLLNLSTTDAENISFGNAKKLDGLSEKELANHFPWR